MSLRLQLHPPAVMLQAMPPTLTWMAPMTARMRTFTRTSLMMLAMRVMMTGIQVHLLPSGAESRLATVAAVAEVVAAVVGEVVARCEHRQMRTAGEGADRLEVCPAHAPL